MMDVLDRSGWKRCRDGWGSKTSQTAAESAESSDSRSAVRAGWKKRRSSITARRNTVTFDFANLAFSLLFKMTAA
jgi:hypothetical protein